MDGRYPSTLILLLYCGYIIKAEIFSSTARLQNLYASFDSIVNHLDDYIAEEHARLQELKSVRKELTSLQDISTADGLTVSEHPIGAYTIVKTLNRLSRTVAQGTGNAQDFHSNVSSSGESLPSDDDYSGSLSAILRLQTIYKLNTSDLMVGSIKGRQVARLYPSDAVSLAQQAQSKEAYWELSVDWMKAAYEAHTDNPCLSSGEVKALLLNLTEAYLEVWDLSSSWFYISKAKDLYPEDDEVKQLYSDVEVHKMEMMADELEEDSEDMEMDQPSYRNEADWWQPYAALCRGDPEAIISEPESSFCVYTPSSIPFSPVKTEVLSTEPFVAMFHDVLSNTETVRFKDEAFSMIGMTEIQQLYRANVGDPGNSFVSEARVSQLTWIHDTNPIIKNISRRIMEITGLDVSMRDRLSSSEPFQVVNYGIGGHYEPHLDVYDNKTALLSLPNFLLDTGERMATFLFYLGDVVEGGATVFPRAGVRVPVIKNSAAFWYNLLRSGESDPLTLHAGCPVLLGQKWVANKWIREHGQEFRHGCGPTPDTVHHDFTDHGWTINT